MKDTMAVMEDMDRMLSCSRRRIVITRRGGAIMFMRRLRVRRRGRGIMLSDRRSGRGIMDERGERGAYRYLWALGFAFSQSGRQEVRAMKSHTFNDLRADLVTDTNT